MAFKYDLYIDPGHGGSDPGANGFGAKEKDWTLRISLYQYVRFKELGVKVAITRTTDKSLASGPRTALIKNQARYCMSNHFNAANSKARGVEVIHSVWTDDKLAKRFASAICEVSGLPFRRVFSRQADWTKQKLDYYFIPRETGNTESLIFEYGFIDNKADNDYYKKEENLFKVAERVVEEWCKVLGYKYIPPKEEGELTVSQYNELKKLIESQNAKIVKLEKQLAEKLDEPSDNQEPDPDHAKNWEKGKKEGVHVGTNPKHYITKEQTVTMIMNTLNKKLK